MKQLLNRKFGPFDGKTWAIIIVAGVGIGLVIRRRTARDSTTETVDGGSVYYDDATTMPGVQYAGTGTQYNQGTILEAVRADLQGEFGEIWKAIANQKPPPATTNPDDFIRDEIGGLRKGQWNYNDYIVPVLQSGRGIALPVVGPKLSDETGKRTTTNPGIIYA